MRTANHPNLRAEEFIEIIRKEAANAKIIVCIVPNNKKDRYDAIKRFTCTDCPIPTQVCLIKCAYYNAEIYTCNAHVMHM